MTIEQTAKDLATCLHQFQLYGELPYTFHLGSVVDVLVTTGCKDEELLAAAWLHDAIEDQRQTIEDIEAATTSRVALLVWCVSGTGRNRRERWECTCRRIRTCPDAASLKLADRIANWRHSLRSGAANKRNMYLNEHPAFVAGLGSLGDPRLWEQLNHLSEHKV